MPRHFFRQAAELQTRGEPFALATVVRCERPTSARPGSRALIHPDGRLEGWVGGSCATPIVVREALRTLTTGRPRLVRLLGSGAGTGETSDAVIEYPMTCHSGGALEIFVEPHLPAPRLVVVGQTPVTRALVGLGSYLGYAVTVYAPDASASDFPGASQLVERGAELSACLGPGAYLVVASFGDYDEEVLEQAVRVELGYLALVASPRRAAALRAGLLERGLPTGAVAKIKAPAGLDLGAVEPEEIALSILAEIVQLRRRVGAGPAPLQQRAAASEPDTAIDPICGMSVEMASARHFADVDGQTVYFCCAGCKERYLTTMSASAGH